MKYEARLETEIKDIKPVSENTAYPRGRGGRRYLSEEAKDFKEDVAQYMTKAIMESDLPDGYLDRSWEVHIWLGFEDNRKRDIANYEKLIFDALTGIVWEDDDYKHLPRHYTAFEPVDYNLIKIRCLLMENIV